MLPYLELPVPPQVSAQLSEISENVRALHDAHASHVEAQSQLLSTIQARLGRLEVDSSLADLRADVSSLRSIALGRSQFPPVPTTPTIPSWQRSTQGSCTGGRKVEREGEREGERESRNWAIPYTRFSLDR